MTLSAAESRWPELIRHLELVLNGNKITEEEAGDMTYTKKAELIRRDPVTCASYFDHRLRCLQNFLLNKPNGVFAPYTLSDYYNKIEFQQRGSAHNHGLM